MGVRITLSWDDPDDAECVADVLRSAALNRDLTVRDRGLLRDAQDLMDQIDKFRAGSDSR